MFYSEIRENILVTPLSSAIVCSKNYGFSSIAFLSFTELSISIATWPVLALVGRTLKRAVVRGCCPGHTDMVPGIHNHHVGNHSNIRGGEVPAALGIHVTSYQDIPYPRISLRQ